MIHAKHLLLDVGGTFIKCADGRSVPVPSDGSREEIAAALHEAVGPGRPEAVAVAIPGPFDYHKGVFRMRHKFAAVYGERFRDLAGLPEDIPMHFIHDVNCLLLGALHSGATGQARRVALVTLGTGLGFALAVSGKLRCTPAGSPAYSIWNRPYRDGMAEDYVSKRGIMRLWSDAVGRPWPEGRTVKDLELAASGKVPCPVFPQEQAQSAFDEAGRCLAEILTEPLRENEVDCLLVGGQIAKSYSLLERNLRSGLSACPALNNIGALPDIDGACFTGLRALDL
jgi:glucokinase